MTKICTLLELSLVVKKSYCDLELKSSQQYFNTITARRFTACHKPLAHRTHCWSFPRLQQQWQVFLLPLVPCKERQTIVLFFRSDHFIDSTTPPPYFLFVVGCDSWEHVTWYPFEPIRESMKFPLHFNIQVRSRHESSRTWLVWFLMAKKKPFGFGACEIFSSLMWPVFFPRNGLENNNKSKSYMWEKGEA